MKYAYYVTVIILFLKQIYYGLSCCKALLSRMAQTEFILVLDDDFVHSLHHIISYHIISYHTTLYHIILYHIVLYKTYIHIHIYIYIYAKEGNGFQEPPLHIRPSFVSAQHDSKSPGFVLRPPSPFAVASLGIA